MHLVLQFVKVDQPSPFFAAPFSNTPPPCDSVTNFPHSVDTYLRLHIMNAAPLPRPQRIFLLMGKKALREAEWLYQVGDRADSSSLPPDVQDVAETVSVFLELSNRIGQIESRIANPECRKHPGWLLARIFHPPIIATQ